MTELVTYVEKIVAFELDELTYLEENGSWSVYRNVLVAWDEDYDARVLTWIDGLPRRVRKHLLAVSEHEGALSLLWKCAVPPSFREGQFVSVLDDNWCIGQSKTAGGVTGPQKGAACQRPRCTTLSRTATEPRNRTEDAI
jgi:hypothetical protein